MELPRLAAIEEAATVVDPVFLDTPVIRNEALDRALGRELALKVETLTPIRSFKGRGASYLMHRLGAAAARGVVCASAGNFGQGVAHAGRRSGVPVTVYAATAANPLKLAAMRAFGAEVRLDGRTSTPPRRRHRRSPRSPAGVSPRTGPMPRSPRVPAPSGWRWIGPMRWATWSWSP